MTDNELIGDPDARHWANRFASKCSPPDVTGALLFFHDHTIWDQTELEELMLPWFASAIETGRTTSYGGPVSAEWTEPTPLETKPFSVGGPDHPDAPVVGEAIGAGGRPPYIAFFDQFGEWANAQVGWPENGQWCPRHWAPGAHGYNGIGASVAMMTEFGNNESDRSPEALSRKMTELVTEYGGICCAFGDQAMYRIWQDWPATVRLPNQQDPKE
jgi:hypothetical protein